MKGIKIHDCWARLLSVFDPYLQRQRAIVAFATSSAGEAATGCSTWFGARHDALSSVPDTALDRVVGTWLAVELEGVQVKANGGLACADQLGEALRIQLRPGPHRTPVQVALRGARQWPARGLGQVGEEACERGQRVALAEGPTPLGQMKNL